MKLLRVICHCGFHSRKARSGYHFHQWWYPVLDLQTGSLTDLAYKLPEEHANLIQLSKVTKSDADEIHRQFAIATSCELRNRFSGQADTTFDPEIGSVHRCPSCSRESLRLEQAYVVAHCKLDCGHEYQWHDTEQHGCPKCNHRPHRFSVDMEESFQGAKRVRSGCRCSSGLDSVSHLDAYCPKCGALPVVYEITGAEYCGKHHVVMETYLAPSNFLFISTVGLPPYDLFPRCKPWGDAGEGDEGEPMKFCPICEGECEQWRVEQPDVD